MILLQYTLPIVVALAFIALASLVQEPVRQKLMAIIVAGAGAAYLSAFAMHYWEFAFVIAATVCAFRGLTSYKFVGFAWLLHTAWDIVHHLAGAPLLPVSATSSLGCAICDPVIALWCFAGAPSPIQLLRRRTTSPVSTVA